MPRLTRRRRLFREHFGFTFETVPTDYTFGRLKSKLKDFQASSDQLRLINSSTPLPSHWAAQHEKDHVRAVQMNRPFFRRRAAVIAARNAAMGIPAPKMVSGNHLEKPPLPPEGTFAGAPPAMKSRLLVLDASFNPPTRAHAHMARVAVHDVLEEQRAAVAEAEHYAAIAGVIGGMRPPPVVRPETRLVLLLAVNNADKEPQPAPLEDRLAMIYAFAHHLQRELRYQDDSVPIEIALTSEPFFNGKAEALRTASWYPNMRPHMTFRKCDQRGRKLPGKWNMPPMEFITGFDTLVRILDPKYYKDEENKKDDAKDTTGAADQNDVDMTDATGEASHEGKGDEKMATEEAPAAPPPGTLAALLASRPQRRMTPMRRALDPFFAHASLRVMLRPGDDNGPSEEQRRYIAALAGEAEAAPGVPSLDEVGGDVAWMGKVHILSEEESDMAAGVSSSMVRQGVRERGSKAAEGLVYPLVMDWLKKRSLYRRPPPPPGTFYDDGGLVEIKTLGAWRKEDFFGDDDDDDAYVID